MNLLLVFVNFICTGTMRIIMTSDLVLVDAYFTCSGLSFLVSVSSLFPFFFLFLNFQTMQYWQVSFTANFAHPSIGTTFCIVIFGDNTKASIS